MKLKLGRIARTLLGEVAPTVARAIGGPFGGLAASVLESAFPGDTAAEIEKKLAEGHPDTLLALRKAENEMVTRMRELDIDEKALDVENTKDARAMARHTSIWFQFALTVVAMFAFGLLLYVLIIKGQVIPVENKDIAIFLTGQLSGFCALGYNFFLGSSKGSADKARDMAAASLQK